MTPGARPVQELAPGDRFALADLLPEKRGVVLWVGAVYAGVRFDTPAVTISVDTLVVPEPD